MFLKACAYISRGMNKRKLRKRGINISHNVVFNNVKFGEFVNLAHHAQVSNAEIGLRSSIGRYTKIQYAQIGKYCSISWDVTIGAIRHPLHAVSTHAFPYRVQFGLCERDIQLHHEYTYIGNDVWIGCNAVILPGLHIGDGSVIGAGSVVTHDVEPYEIVAGCPARHIGWRFSEKKRLLLLDTKWWNWPDAVIKDNIDIFDINVDLDNDDVISQALFDISSKESKNQKDMLRQKSARNGE